MTTFLLIYFNNAEVTSTELKTLGSDPFRV